jgi:cell cycle arrest protein BUB2
LDRCLEILDLELYSHLRSKKLSAEIYAFPSVLTFCACTPPLEEVLQLWDFLLAYGVHLNVLCIIGQLFLMRSDLMNSQRCAHDVCSRFTLTQPRSPMKLLRTFPPLDAQQIIAITVTLVRDIPVQLYEELTCHPWEMTAL